MQGILTSPLLNLIREKQLADEEVLEAIQGEHNLNGELIYGLVHNHGVLDLAAQLALMAEYLGTDVIDVTEIDYTEELLALIPLETAHNYKCLPIGLAGETLHLSMVDPLNPTLLDELSFQLKRPVQIRIGSPEAIQTLIDDKYSKDDSMEDLIEALSHVNIDEDEDEEESESLEILEEVGDASPIVRFVNMVLYQALKDRAADVHFEPFEDNYQIRMKVDGVMKILTPPPKELAPAIASRLKIMAGLNITERRLPQDGRIAEIIAGEELVFRMSTLPTKFGESVALRLLDSKNQELVALDALNIPERVDASIRHCVNQPNGVFLVTGPTGSGKTTTLYACLRMLNTIEVKILTCEDPVEFPVEGIIQCQINDKQGFTFVRALRSFLRQDPDIILVGEMRDLETSSIAIEAALTGHLVVSTLHTNSSTEAVTRMVDMGLEPFMIASSVNGVLAQRLVRTVCPKCRVSSRMTKDQMDMMELTEEEVGGREIHYGTGCDACNGTGYKGLQGIFEMLQMDDEVRELIATNTPALLLRQKCVETGMQTLRMDGLRLMFSGVSTFEEVMKYS